jgi:hypothetical protein
VGARLSRYLGSRKHMAGATAALVGVGLSLTGVTGSLWPLVVAGLYGAGALAAPAEPRSDDRVRQLLESAAREAAELLGDLARIAERVQEAGPDLPAGAPAAFEQVERKLAGMLRHPTALADRDARHVLSTIIRTDLDQIVGAYLRLPAHLRHRPIPSGTRTPANELVHQLGLLDEYVTFASERVFSAQTQDIADLGHYLESRNELERPDP